MGENDLPPVCVLNHLQRSPSVELAIIYPGPLPCLPREQREDRIAELIGNFGRLRARTKVARFKFVDVPRRRSALDRSTNNRGIAAFVAVILSGTPVLASSAKQPISSRKITRYRASVGRARYIGPFFHSNTSSLSLFLTNDDCERLVDLWNQKCFLSVQRATLNLDHVAARFSWYSVIFQRYWKAISILGQIYCSQKLGDISKWIWSDKKKKHLIWKKIFVTSVD